MKITKADYEALPAAMKAAFSSDEGTEEYSNGEENVDGLKSALTKEKDEAATLKTRLAGFESEKTKEIEAARKKALEDARSSGDFAAIEKDYQNRIKALEDSNRAALVESENRLKGDAVGKEVEKLSKLFVSPTLAKSFIQSRLAAELVDGVPIVRVLDSAGKPSAASVSDLEKEYLTNTELKGSLVASRATGGGSGVAPTGGGSGVANDKFNALEASPAEMVARLEATGAVTTEG